MGGGVKQLQVQPNPNKMLALGVSFDQIREAAGKAVRNTTGGFLTDRDQEIMVRHLAMTTDVDELGDTVVARVVSERISLGTRQRRSADDDGDGGGDSDEDDGRCQGGARIQIQIPHSPRL